MRVLVVDVENSVVWREDGTIDGSPFNARNRLVSVGWKLIVDGRMHRTNYAFFHHDWLDRLPGEVAHDFGMLQEALNAADLIVAHNIKHDAMWLEETGFVLSAPLYCTMIAEYVLARGAKIPLNLAETAGRYRVTAKKSELIDDYWKRKIGFDYMPPALVEEYGIADVDSCAEVFMAQLLRYEHPSNRGLVPTRDMSMEFCRVLTDMERAGIRIDQPALDRVAEEYRAERAALLTKLHALVHAVMGDTPVNLASPEQLSAVIYSRRVTDKAKWAETFNLGLDERGKPFRRPRMSGAEFGTAVRQGTTTFRKTKAVPCPSCNASGAHRKTKKNGAPWKNLSKCPACAGQGCTYEDLKPGFAGLQCVPLGVDDVAAGGFSTDKATLKRLAMQAGLNGKPEAEAFLMGVMRLSAIDSYLSSFVGGIRRGVQADSVLHTHLNQCIAATGRLTSSEPNFQNQPRAKTFPVRRVVVSRFPGGWIIEADFAQLEFRVAGELAGCTAIRQVVDDGRDVHRITGSVIFRRTEAAVTDSQRQTSKAYTFAPLYGGMGMDEPPHVQSYFHKFASELYPGVGEWHKKLADEAVATGKLRLPSGREYGFPNTRRTQHGCTNYTKIKNYPVQGYATADIVPVAVIRAARAFKALKLRSLLILTVHDSIEVDCYPGEEAQVRDTLTWAMLGVVDELKTRYSVDFKMPLGIEIKSGPNWLDMKVEPEVENWRRLDALLACSQITFPLVSFSSAVMNDPIPDFLAAA